MGFVSDIRDEFSRLTARRYRTMFGTARIYTTSWENTRIRILDVEGTYQSATYIDDRWCEVPFPYLARYGAVFEAEKPIQTVCMLGGGGYAFPKYVIAHHPHARIDVVEIDPAITRIARKHFYLDCLEETYRTRENERMRIVTADACAHLEHCARNKVRYDAIVNDCFAGTEPENAFLQPATIDLVQSCLTPHGMYLTNIITALEGDEAAPLQNLTALLSASFNHVCALTCGRLPEDEPDNVVVVASNTDPQLAEAIRIFDAS